MLKKLFGIEAGFTLAMEKIADLFLASVLWFLCSIPLVTIFLSTSALYYVVVKCIRKERGSVCAEFVKFLKENWKQGILLGMIQLLLAMLVGYNAYAVLQMDHSSMLFHIYIVIAFWLVLCFVFINIYMPAIYSRFCYQTIEYIKVSMLLSWRHVFSSLVGTVIVLGSVYFLVQYPIFCIIVPAFVLLFISFRMEKILKRYMPEPKEGEPLMWYYDEKEVVQNDEKNEL